MSEWWKLAKLRALFNQHPREIIPYDVLLKVVETDTRQSVHQLIHRLRSEDQMSIATIRHTGYAYRGFLQTDSFVEDMWPTFKPYNGKQDEQPKT